MQGIHSLLSNEEPKAEKQRNFQIVSLVRFVIWLDEFLPKRTMSHMFLEKKKKGKIVPLLSRAYLIERCATSVRIFIKDPRKRGSSNHFRRFLPSPQGGLSAL